MLFSYKTQNDLVIRLKNLVLLLPATLFIHSSLRLSVSPLFNGLLEKVCDIFLLIWFLCVTRILHNHVLM